MASKKIGQIWVSVPNVGSPPGPIFPSKQVKINTLFPPKQVYTELAIAASTHLIIPLNAGQMQLLDKCKWWNGQMLHIVQMCLWRRKTTYWQLISRRLLAICSKCNACQHLWIRLQPLLWGPLLWVPKNTFHASLCTYFTFILCRRLKKDVFYLRAEEEGLQLPQIHLLINNRVSEYELRCALRNS